MPHHAAKKFKTSRDNLRSIRVPVVEGESRRPDECIALGKCVVRDLPTGLPKGTEIIVEFHYEANGRISVLGRVPRTRQSAQVQIEREKPHSLEDLGSWRAKLCAGAGELGDHVLAIGGTPEVPELQAAIGPPTDRISLMQQLDRVYTKLGKLAVKTQVPAALDFSHRAAAEATKQWKQARSALEQVDRTQRVAAGRTETLQSMTELSRARMAVKESETKAIFALLVLGRECERANFQPPGSQREILEIQRLKSQLERPD